MRTRIMLDIETLGTRPGSIIRTVGAVKFGDTEIVDSFYRLIDAESCEAAGLVMDAKTVTWWLQQTDGARVEMTLPGEPLRDVLEALAAWIGDPEAEVWGNGPSFDCALMVSAYDALKMKAPWRHHNERCYRTISALRPEMSSRDFRTGVLHNALEDARTQAENVMRILGDIARPSVG